MPACETKAVAGCYGARAATALRRMRTGIALAGLLAMGHVMAATEKITGYWINSDASYYYRFEVNFDLKDAVDGYFLWTLLASPKQEDASKIGLQGREYVRGTFNSISRQLELNGYRKDDPNSILGLDEYRLKVAANGQQMFGATRNGGDWGGRLDSRAVRDQAFLAPTYAAADAFSASGDSPQAIQFGRELVEYEKLFDSRRYLAALNLLRVLADKNNYLAQAEMAKHWWWGYGVLVDRERANGWCKKAMAPILAQAEAGSAEMALQARRFFNLGCGTQEDKVVEGKWRAIGIQRFLPRALAGEVYAMEQLANLYGFDFLDDQSKIKEAIWLENAAYGGSGHAAYVLGLRYTPLYVSRKTDSEEKAKYWFGVAFRLGLAQAKAGDVQAQESVAYFYRNGRGTPPDGVEAFRWYEAAAAQGNREAQTVLGSHFLKSGAYEKALAYLGKAADQGCGDAMFELADMARDGKGLKKSPELYKTWLKKAANQGHMRAQSVLENLP